MAEALAALGLPADESTARPPFRWARLRDVLACLLAERPGRRPAGLDDSLWRLINARVRPQPAAAVDPLGS